MTINNNALKRKERGCIVAFRWSEWRWQIGLVVSTGSRPSVYPVGLLTSVKNALVSTTLGGLSLLLLLDLGGLRLNLSGTSERSVNLSHFEVTLVRFRCKKLSSFATHKRGGTDPGAVWLCISQIGRQRYWGWWGAVKVLVRLKRSPMRLALSSNLRSTS